MLMASPTLGISTRDWEQRTADEHRAMACTVAQVRAAGAVGASLFTPATRMIAIHYDLSPHQWNVPRLHNFARKS
jgi:hypothetical protein